MKADRHRHRPLAGPQVGRADLRQADPAHPAVVLASAWPSSAATRSWSTAGWPASACASPIADTTRVLSRQVAAIVWRTYGQDRIEEMAAISPVPVVNALTDQFHPCQILADLQTVREHKQQLAGLTFAYLGDAANNMAHSYLLGGAAAGLHVRIAGPTATSPTRRSSPPPNASPPAPAGRSPSPTDPAAALDGADVVATDTWVSMGQEDEKAEREAPFRAVRGDRASAGPGRGRRDRAALPARLPRQGDRRRRHRRPAERRLGRGREPAARAEGAAHLPAGARR